jgi:hypothetical protein
MSERRNKKDIQNQADKTMWPRQDRNRNRF